MHLPKFGSLPESLRPLEKYDLEGLFFFGGGGGRNLPDSDSMLGIDNDGHCC